MPKVTFSHTKKTVEANEGQRKRLKQKLENPKGDEDE